MIGLAVGLSWTRLLARGRGDSFARLAIGAGAVYLAAFGWLAPELDRLRIATPIAEAVARQLRPGDPPGAQRDPLRERGLRVAFAFPS